jgi:hypothetical protein
MFEADIKTGLMAYLERQAPHARLQFIKEFKLERGIGRADLVEVTQFHCYEIKSQADSLARLIGQGARYGKTFSHVTLVTAERHLARALPLLPSWWGVLLVPSDPGEPFRQLRQAKINRRQEAYSLAATLAREECLTLLADLGHERGWRSRSLYEMQIYLAGALAVTELAELVPSQVSRRSELQAA